MLHSYLQKIWLTQDIASGGDESPDSSVSRDENADDKYNLAIDSTMLGNVEIQTKDMNRGIDYALGFLKEQLAKYLSESDKHLQHIAHLILSNMVP